MFEIVRELVAIAKAEAELHPDKPLERCGVIVNVDSKPKIVEINNVAADPHQRFRFDPQQYARVLSMYEVLEIWHTHPNQSAAASQADLVEIEKMRLPWHIVSWPGAQHTYAKPSGYVAPYEGRVFYHGILDCYALCRDWYKREMNIDLPDDDRPDDWWKMEGYNIYVDGFERNGFVNMGSDPSVLLPGDGVLMQHCADRPNHAAIYVGDGKILHHVHGRVSGYTPYGGYWAKCTTHILRHRSKL